MLISVMVMVSGRVITRFRCRVSVGDSVEVGRIIIRVRVRIMVRIAESDICLMDAITGKGLGLGKWLEVWISLTEPCTGLISAPLVNISQTRA